MNTKPFRKQVNHVTVVAAEGVFPEMITIEQDSSIIAILPKDAQALAEALIEAGQYIKDLDK